LQEEIVFSPKKIIVKNRFSSDGLTKGRVRSVRYSELLEQGKCLVSILDRRGRKYVSYVIRNKDKVPRKQRLSSRPRGIVLYYNMDKGVYFLIDRRS